jgi:hypothetical protein
MGCVMQKHGVSGHSTSSSTSMLTSIKIPVIFPVTFFLNVPLVFISIQVKIFVCVLFFPFYRRVFTSIPHFMQISKYLAGIAGSLYQARNVSFT